MGGIGSGRPPGVKNGEGKKAKAGRAARAKERTGRRFTEATALSAEEDAVFVEACEKAGVSRSSAIRQLMAHATGGFKDWSVIGGPGLKEWAGFRQLTDEERAARYREDGYTVPKTFGTRNMRAE